MKKETSMSIFLILVLVFLPIISAEIIMDKQPNQIYNLGDAVSIPLTIKASQDISDQLNLDLVCTGQNVNFYKNGISLNYGEELKLSPAPSLLLTKNVIGEIKGNCKIKAILGEESILTNEFKISNLINLNATNINQEFSPGEDILIEGTAIKENLQPVNGFIEMQIIITEKNQTSNMTQLSTINNGYFAVNTSLPEDMKAGSHLMKLKAYEKFNNEITNHGTNNYNIYLRQIPTSLEIVFESSDITPGENLEVKAVLRDQTGEKIESNAVLTIKDSEGVILEQEEKPTDEFLEYPVLYNEPPANWSVVAASERLITEANFKITRAEKIDLQMVNQTLIATNTGNVPYNKTVLVKIGDNSITLDLLLNVGESEKFILSAPDGEYNIEILSNGENLFTGNAVLTGKTTEVKKAYQGIKGLFRYPLAWIFLIAILGFITFLVFKKGYKKSFIGKFNFKKTKNQNLEKMGKESKKDSKQSKKSLINPSNIAELSLSIKGDRQSVSLVGLKIKNLPQVKSKKSNASETLQKIVDLAEHNKAYAYQNQEYIFFIFAPIITKTFRNEKTAINFAHKAEEVLKEHNKKFRQKINFGISINYGEIVAKLEKDSGSLKFMSMKTLIPQTKKISGQAQHEVLLGKDFNEKLDSSVKTQKYKGNYKIKNMINREEHKAFISNFLQRLEHHEDKSDDKDKK